MSMQTTTLVSFPGRLLTFPPLTSGDDVRAWQARMAARGFAIDVDGKYGAQSVRACRQLQAFAGLDVDGKVGPATWAATFEGVGTGEGRGSDTRQVTFGWEEIHSFVQARLGAGSAQNPTPGQSDRGEGQGSHHFRRTSPDGIRRGHAIDYGFGPSDAHAIWNLLLPFAQGANAPIREMFFDPRGGFDEGVDIGAIGDHDDHIHIAIAVGAQLPA
ncbi:MAG TPA: peptidoglycan-binding domain-containing protein [Acidimicrobiales bacterium]|nr:peptidoglycan-binding domain-containing protein [Acidimicrobiales bacterium]